MASSGKKGKKVKGKKIALQEFLSDAPVPPPPMIRKSNWSDDPVEDVLPAVKSYLPTAPRAARANGIDESLIPKDGPFVAYIFNLLYDVEENDIREFFSEANVTNIRLPRDDRTGKLKGFGYVDFGDRSSLIQALNLTDTLLKGRRVRISLSENNERENRRGGGMRDRERDYDPERTTSDWRSGPRAESTAERPRWDYGSRDSNRDRDRERGGDRDRDRDREGDGEAGGNWRDAPRKPLDERDGGRSNFGPRRFNERREPSPPANRTRPKLNLKPRTLPLENLKIEDGEDSSAQKSSIFGNAKPVDTKYDADEEKANKEESGENVGESGAPKAKPVKPVSSNPFGSARPVDTTARERAVAAKVEEPSAPRERPAKPSAASIFGSAKPVDTATREREIEERLAKERQPSIDPAKPREDRENSQERKEVRSEKIDAPPPTENAWTKRSQKADSEAPRSDDSSERPSSRNSQPEEKKENGPRDTRPDNRDRITPADRDRSGDRGRNGDRDRYPPRRGGDRDRDDRDHYRDRDYNRRDRYDDRDYNRRDRDRYDDRRDDRDRDYRRDDRSRDFNRRDDYSRRDDDRDRDSRRDDRDRDVRREDRDRDNRKDDRDRDSRRDDRDRDNRREDRDRDSRRDDRDRDNRREDRDHRSGDRDKDHSRGDDRRRDGDRERRPAPESRSRDTNHHDDRDRSGANSRPVRDSKEKPREREPRPPREMPKATEASAPNYVAANKYSFLEEDAPAE